MWVSKARSRLCKCIIAALVFSAAPAAVRSQQGSAECGSQQRSSCLDPQQLGLRRDATRLVPVFLIQHVRYGVGEPILVRLGFKNTSSHPIDIRSGAPPWQQSTVSIIGPDGRTIPPGLAEIGGDDGSGRLFIISPGATQFINWDGQEWYSLDHWSYHLTMPGRYRLVVRALPSGAITRVGSEQSTTVSLTIEQ